MQLTGIIAGFLAGNFAGILAGNCAGRNVTGEQILSNEQLSREIFNGRNYPFLTGDITHQQIRRYNPRAQVLSGLRQLKQTSNSTVLTSCSAIAQYPLSPRLQSF